MYWINCKVLFTQTKWIFLNLWYRPIRISVTTVRDKTTKFLFHLPCCWLPHKLFNFRKRVIIYHIQCFQFWFSLPADSIKIYVDGVYRCHSNCEWYTDIRPTFWVLSARDVTLQYSPSHHWRQHTGHQGWQDKKPKSMTISPHKKFTMQEGIMY